jgi:hypothetical protein
MYRGDPSVKIARLLNPGVQEENRREGTPST